MRRIAEIDALIRAKSDDVKKLKEERSALQERVLDEFAEAGVDAVTVTADGRPRAVSIRKVTVAHFLKGPEAATVALDAAGYGHLVAPRANKQQVDALVRELLQSPDGLPDEFEGVITSFDNFSVSSRLA
mgnify:FL=1